MPAKSYLDSLVDDFKFEEVKDEAQGIFDDDKLPIQEPLQMSFLEFCLTYIPEIEPRFEVTEPTRLLIDEVEGAITGRNKRLALGLSPGLGKSLILAAGFVWSLMTDPTRSQLFVSSSSHLAAQHARKILQLFLVAGGVLSPRSKSVTAWMPHWRWAKQQTIIGATGSVLGTRSACTFIDDPQARREDAMSPVKMEKLLASYSEDWLSRGEYSRSGSGNNLILCAQRLAKYDLLGVIAERDKEAAKRGKGTKWRCLLVPARYPTLEERAQIVSEYPDGWKVLLPKGPEGECVSPLLDDEALAAREIAMSPEAFDCMYRCITSNEGTSQFKERYLVQVPEEDLECGSTVLSLDLAVTGEGDQHGYAVLSTGLYDCAGKVIIREVGSLSGSFDDLIPQVVELARRFRVSAIVTEKGGSGHWLVKTMNAYTSEFGANVKPLSHEGKSKQLRLERHLGYFSMGNVLVPAGSPWIVRLLYQARQVLNGVKRAQDDQIDAVEMGLRVCLDWNKGGWRSGTAEWSRAATPGQTTVTWGYGARAANVRPLSDPNRPFPGYTP